MMNDADSTGTRPRAWPAHFEMYSLGQDGVHWRLLSANNRGAGRSASSYPDVEACRSGLERLLGVINDLQPSHTLTFDHRWEWQLGNGDTIVARSSHSFDRRLRCVAACDWFIRTAPLAGIHSTLRVTLDASARGSAEPLADAGSVVRPPLMPDRYARYRVNLSSLVPGSTRGDPGAPNLEGG
jgi:hypothetical protein